MKYMKKISLAFLLLFFLLLASAVATTSVSAQGEGVLDAIGTIDKPPGVAEFDEVGGIAEGDIGILFFASRLISVLTIFAGLWTFFNVLIAGYTYVTSSGNAQSHTLVRDKLTMSFLGIILIVTVYTMAGLVGLMFFGDAAYLLNPTIQGPTAI